MAEACLGKASCSISVHWSNFAPDPCPGKGEAAERSPSKQGWVGRWAWDTTKLGLCCPALTSFLVPCLAAGKRLTFTYHCSPPSPPPPRPPPRPASDIVATVRIGDSSSAVIKCAAGAIEAIVQADWGCTDVRTDKTSYVAGLCVGQLNCTVSPAWNNANWGDNCPGGGTSVFFWSVQLF